MSIKNYTTGNTNGTIAAGEDSYFVDIPTKAAMGANSDITSLIGLTTALLLVQGGTGAATAASMLHGLIGSANVALTVDDFSIRSLIA